MPDMFTTDIDNCIKAMEYFIIIEEEGLIQENAGDSKWQYLEPFRATLNNLQYLKGIYG
tara:strand:- start:760 stop:936 length:177 start_codon:yes stop_codon:yes gene_type:complete